MMGQPIVVLHSAEAATDLMDKRSNIYSDRPTFHFFEEYYSFDPVLIYKFLDANSPQVGMERIIGFS